MKVAILFDFDETLAPDSTDGFLEYMGLDRDKFWNAVGVRQANGYCRALAYLGHMIHLAEEVGMTQDKMVEWGKQAPLFPGADDLVERLKYALRGEVELHAFCISTGVLSILQATKMAAQFKKIWASEFAYNNDGYPIEVMRTVNFTEKTRYLFHVSKGIFDDDYMERVNQKHLSYEIPLENMIMVGDGFSDIPVFSLLKQKGGTAIGVRTNKNEALLKDSRVEKMVDPVFAKGSEGEQVLLDAVRQIAQRKN